MKLTVREEHEATIAQIQLKILIAKHNSFNSLSESSVLYLGEKEAQAIKVQAEQWKWFKISHNEIGESQELAFGIPVIFVKNNSYIRLVV